MNNPIPRELRKLIASLSDGTLTATEASRLNELLKADSIAREQYLDHILIDGLLEREFGGAPIAGDDFIIGEQVRTGESLIVCSEMQSRGLHLGRFFRLHWPNRVLVPGALTALIAVGWFLWSSGKEQRQPLQLADSGFESGTLVVADAMPKAAWYGDVADVVGQYANVTPLEGGRMLRFVKSKIEPEDACELYQIVDLGAAAHAIARHPMSVEASAFFNAIREDLPEHDCAFGVTVYAFSSDPSLQPLVWPIRGRQALTFNGSQTRADADSRSWQQVTARLPLPANTKFLVVQIAVIHTDADQQSGEFPGQFADSVALNLVSLR